MEILGYVFLFCAIVIFVFGIEDFFWDIYVLLRKIKPVMITEKGMRILDTKPQKNIAIIMPAWKESNIIKRTLTKALGLIDYTNFYIFVGVYPNDQATIKEVLSLNNKRIILVTNTENGPTSKGQMLNQVVDRVRNFKADNGRPIDIICMNDAEDIIHPKSLQLANFLSDTFHFIQIPIFSLKTKYKNLVGGIYMDEFAELHTKDLLIRNSLNAPIPSAGVGTFISMKVVNDVKYKIGLFNEQSVTEDYELGTGIEMERYRSVLASAYYVKYNGDKEYVATREFFPSKLKTSIKQKTRWTLGIIFQGWKNLGWFRSFKDNIFLYRDRRGVVVNFFSFIAYVYVLLILCNSLFLGNTVFSFGANTLAFKVFVLLMIINIFFMWIRMFSRFICTTYIYGLSHGLLSVVRWPISVIINFVACVRASYFYFCHVFFGRKITWDKTHHEIPKQ